jgi:hypothetical protein
MVSSLRDEAQLLSVGIPHLVASSVHVAWGLRPVWTNRVSLSHNTQLGLVSGDLKLFATSERTKSSWKTKAQSCAHPSR